MEFLQQIINGVALGSIYALIALGYTMVYGIVRLINFAHGDVYMVGAYVGYFVANWMLAQKLGYYFPVALVLSMAVAAILGVVIERLAYKPLRNAAKIAVLTAAIGVSLFLENFARWLPFIGPNPRGFPDLFKRHTYTFAHDQLYVSNVQVVVLVVTLVLMVGLQYLVLRTKIGKAMRAVSFDKDTARLMGINVDRIISVTFALGSALAAAAGVLVGIAYPRIDPYMGIMPGLKAFVAAVLGGIGIIPGAALGGIIMGVSETMAIQFFPSTFKDAVAFVILIIVLLVRPTGILGKYASEKV